MIERKNKFKKWVVILGSLILAGVAMQYAMAQSSGPKINLNSPVSFPVDI